MCGFITSCQVEENSIQNSLESVIENLIQKAKEENDILIATIRKNGNYYMIESIKDVDEITAGLYLGMKSNISGKIGFTDIVVTCVDSGDTTVCSGNGGLSQQRCVGKAIAACFDNGECAEVCEQEILIIPPGIK